VKVHPGGICVNCVAPGSTLSEEAPDEGTMELRRARVVDQALPRTQGPADLAGATSSVTGQTPVVDGGAYMH
jgi:3-oxoacyl-[acyl-carrier protein] reductase